MTAINSSTGTNTPEASICTPKRQLDDDDDKSSISLKRQRTEMSGLAFEKDRNASRSSTSSLDDLVDYSIDCDIYKNDNDPTSIAEKLACAINTRLYLDTKEMCRIAAWLRHHLDASERTSHEWRTGYSANTDFWKSLFSFIRQLSAFHHVFAKPPHRLGRENDLVPSLTQFFQDALELVVRHIGLVCTPNLEHLATAEKHIINTGALCTAAALMKDKPLKVYLSKHGSLDSDKLHKIIAKHLHAAPTLVRQLHSMLCKLHTQDEHDPESFSAIKGLCAVVPRMLALQMQAVTEHDTAAYEANWETLKLMVELFAFEMLPKCSTTTSRITGHSYQTHVIEGLAVIMRSCLGHLYISELGDIYDLALYALASLGTADVEQCQSLNHATHRQNLIVVQELWKIYTYMLMVRGNTLELRIFGLTGLTRQLGDMAKNPSTPSAMVRISCAIMLECQLIDLVFGKDMHAALITGSKDIVLLLVKAGLWSQDQTRRLWRMMVNTSHDEVKNAIYDILHAFVPELQAIDLVAMLEEYYQSEMKETSPHELLLFREILVVWNQRSNGDTAVELAKQSLLITGICLKLFQHSHDGPLDRTAICQIARSTMLQLLLSSPDSAGHILQHCAQQIQNRTDLATSAFEAVLIYLNTTLTRDALERLLMILPVNDVVAEFCDFIQNCKTKQLEERDLVSCGLRMRSEVVIHLLYVGDRYAGTLEATRFWTYALGEHAIDHAARNEVLNLALAMRAKMAGPEALSAVLDQHLDAYILIVHSDYVTRGLVVHAKNRLKARIVSADRDDFTTVTTDKQWQNLLEHACTTCDVEKRKHIIHSMCDCLFLNLPECSPDQMLNRVQAFVDQQMEQTRQDLEQDEEMDTSITAHCSARLKVLTAILEVCQNAKVMPPANKAVAEPCEENAGTDLIDVIFKIVPPGGLSNVVSSCTLQLPRESKCCHLLQLLTERYGATDFMVYGSRHLSRVAVKLSKIPDHSVVKVAGDPSGMVILSACTLDEIAGEPSSTKVCVVEAALDSHRSFLESLLGASPMIAEAAYHLLDEMELKSEQLQSIKNMKFPDGFMFPPDNPWRCQYSLSLLQRQLSTCRSQLTNADDFVQRGLSIYYKLLYHEEYRGLTLCQEYAASSLVRALKTDSSTADGDTKQQWTAWTRSFVASLHNAEDEPCSRLLAMLLDRSYTTRLSRDHATLLALHKEVYQLLQYLVEGSEEHAVQLVRSKAFLQYHMWLFAADLFGSSQRTLGHVLDMASGITDKALFFWLTNMLDAASQMIRLDQKSDRLLCHVRKVYQKRSKTCFSRAERFHCFDLTQRLLWSYKHDEHHDIGLPDETIFQILALIMVFRDQLAEDGPEPDTSQLAQDIFFSLLFPDTAHIALTSDQNSSDFSSNREHTVYKDEGEQDMPTPSALSSRSRQVPPLIHADTRSLCLQILTGSTCDTQSRQQMLAHLNMKMRRFDTMPHAFFPYHPPRDPRLPAGLSNLGMTCYMNSLLQQIYHNLNMRKLLLRAENGSGSDFLYLLQNLFANMQSSTRQFADTSSLARKMNIPFDTQEDAHSFWTIILSAIESALEPANARNEFTQIYTGEQQSQIIGKCRHLSVKVETYSDIPLTVQNKSSLIDSLEEFVKGEAMVGANCYKCTACDPASGGKLVEAVKRTCFKTLPDTVVFCLKRFTYDMSGRESKNNDPFSFPEVLDMAPYQLRNIESKPAKLEPDMYRLTGIIVHSGSMSFGHYWSYALRRESRYLDGPKWYRLEDSTVTMVADFQALQEECFGASGSSHSAYVLFYERESSLEDSIISARLSSPHHVHGHLLPLRMPLSAHTVQEFRERNALMIRFDHISSTSFHEFLTAQLSALDSLLQKMSGRDKQIELYSQTLAQGVIAYLRHVSLGQPEHARYTDVRKHVLTLVQHHFVFATDFVVSWIAYKGISETAYRTCRPHALETVTEALMTIRRNNPEIFLDLLVGVLADHRGMTNSQIGLPWYTQWDVFFYIPLIFLDLGPGETYAVLQQRYFEMALEIVNQTDHKYPPIRDHLGRVYQVKYSSVFHFMHKALARVVDGITTGADLAGMNQLLYLLGVTTRMQSLDCLSWLVNGVNLDSYGRDNSMVELLTLTMQHGNPKLQVAVLNSIMVALKTEQYTPETMVAVTEVFCWKTESPDDAYQVLATLVSHTVAEQIDVSEEILALLTDILPRFPTVVMRLTGIWLMHWLKPQESSEQAALAFVSDLLNQGETLHQECIMIEDPLQQFLLQHNAVIVEQCCDLLADRIPATARRGDYDSITAALQAALATADGYKERIAELFARHDQDPAPASVGRQLMNACNRLSKACERAQEALEDPISWLPSRSTYYVEDDDAEEEEDEDEETSQSEADNCS